MSKRNNKIADLAALVLICIFVNGAWAQDDGFEDFDFDDTSAAIGVESGLADDEFKDFEDFDFDDADESITSENLAQPLEAEPNDEFAEELEAFEAEPVVEATPVEAPTNEAIEEDIFAEPAPEPVLEDLQIEPETQDFFAEELPVQPLNSPPLADEPDYALEAKLHDIYINFYNEKTSDTEWDSLSAGRSSESYNIQSGDTLWSISKTFFGDGNYWPKIWSLNSRITNPHLIQPGNMIRFLLGNESQPPAFTVTEAEDSDSSQAEVNLAAGGPAAQVPDIPNPAIKSRPVVKKLPPSFPKWQDLSNLGEYDDLGIDYGKRKITDLIDEIPLGGYIAENPPVGFGNVSEIEGGSNIASALQYIYVSVDLGAAQVGDNLLVIRNAGKLENVHPSISGFLGYSIEIQGEVQLVERVAVASAKSSTETYRAIVTRIVNPVSVGSQIVRGNVERISLSEDGPRSQIVAQIIGGLYFNKRQVYGNESIAFLNKGSASGLEPGQILSIRENRKVRNSETNVQENVRPIGWLKILKTTNDFSTAVVLRAWSDVLTGDITGAGEFTESIRAQETGGSSGPVDTAEGNLNEEFDSQ